MTDRHSTTRRGFAKTVAATTLGAWTAAASSAAEKPRIAVALLGAAHIHTPMFLQVLRSRDDVKIIRVWDHDSARAERWAKECRARPAKSVEEVLSDGDVAAVVVLSETLLHAELAIAAAKAKKHLFVEKPLAVGAADAAQIAEAVEQSGVLFTAGYYLRTIPKYLFIKENLAKGHFGRIVRAHCAVTNDCVLQGAFDTDFQWTTDRKWGALGGFADLGTHALDALMWMLGDVESVAAETRSLTNRYPHCDETGQAMLRFTSGAAGTIAASWVEPDNPVSFSLVGTEGHAVIFNDRLYLRTKKVAGADGARPWGKLPPGPDHPLLQFVSAVSGEKNLPLVPVREAAARVKVMEAIYRAAREGKWVAVV